MEKNTATTDGADERAAPSSGGDPYAVKSSVTADSEQLESEFSDAEKTQITRRIDKRLVLTVGFMYCVSLLDRTNLGAANLAGISDELGLDGIKYVSVGPRLLSVRC